MSCSEAGAGKGDREERGEGRGDDSGVMDWGPPNSKASRKSCLSQNTQVAGIQITWSDTIQKTTQQQ